MYQQLIEEFVHQEGLPSSYAEDVDGYFLPLVQDLECHLTEQQKRPFTVGITGAQGTGKSAMAKLLALLLQNSTRQVVNLCIDDFYFSRTHRTELARTIHPLLKTRGVPGTHDLDLAMSVLHKLGEAGSADYVTLPGFDKANDDCLPSKSCARVNGPVDVIILEGWFVGATAQTEQELSSAVNELESQEDIQGHWRQYVNQQLAADYQTLFAKVDMLLMLKAPDFERVFEWRSLQEQKLRSQTKKTASGLMDGESIKRFIQHFERLTRHCLRTLPDKAHRVFELDERHRIHCVNQTSP